MYASLSDLKSYLGITSADDDALLTSLLASAQAAIDAYCDRTFEADVDSTRTFDAVCDVDGLTLYLDRDLHSITSVTNGDGTEITSSQYVTEPRNDPPYYAIRLKASANVNWTYDDDPENAIEVVGRWAYSVSPPQDIVHVTLRLAGYLYRQRDNANDLDRAVVAGNTTILPQQLPQDIRTFLAPYRRLV